MTRSIGTFLLIMMGAMAHADAVNVVTGSLGATSDFVFRGLSLTRGKPAAQASLDVEFPKEFYVGAFVATADPLFRRTDRIRLQMLVSDPGAVVTAALLDRVGKAIPLPVATTVRADGGSTWAVSDLMLAPLTLGDYALRMTVTEAGAPRETVTAFRIVG